MEVIVKRAGMQTTVQDLGRPGHREHGVPLGGAMDRLALRVANLLVGNDEAAAALEFVLSGPELLFPRETVVAVTGGDFGGPPRWQTLRVAAGTVLKFSAARTGCRGYLAIAGGFAVPPVLGSAGTYLRAGFGGLGGRALRDGDTLAVADVTRTVAKHWHIDPRLIPTYHDNPTVQVLRGAQGDEFGRTFFEAPFRVTAQSDRMGFRLKGPALVRSVNTELRSSTVAPGTIQVPPDGQPIVLMADAQTIGGYPQIAHVITADLPKVAQLRPGDTVRWVEVSLEVAHEVALAGERALAMLRHGLAQKLA
jgi:antagonist of KipI